MQLFGDTTQPAALPPAAGDELVGVREAARALGVNASTISRQVRSGVIPNRGTHAKPLVNVAEARSKRAEALNPLKARQRGGVLGYEQSLAEAESAPAAPASSETRALGGAAPRSGIAAAHSAEKTFRAKLLQLQLAEKTKAVVLRRDVENGGFAAAQAVQSALASRVLGLADELATMTDPREIAGKIEESDRAILEAIGHAVQAMLSEFATPDDAAA